MIRAIRMGIGLGMVLTPFALMTWFMFANGGLIAVALIWGTIAAVVALLFGGFYLLQPR